MRTALLAALLLGACDVSAPLGTEDSGDATAEVVVSDVAVDAEAVDEASPDGDEQVPDADDGGPIGPPTPGPLTFVADDVEVLTDRICDFDGDGDMDNAMADLGEPGSTVFSLTLNAALATLIRDEGERYVFYFPWLDERNEPHDPATRLIGFLGMDADVPVDLADDFSGEEPFDVWRGDVDGCGEPRHVFEDASVEHGTLAAEGGTVPIPGLAPGRGTKVWGHVARRGSAAELELCAYVLARELGEPSIFPGMGGLTTLEALLSAGDAFGLPGVSGLIPDVDVDGDGLEQFEVDSEHHIASCVDGDGTEIAGRECWQDERMADAFSVAMVIRAVPARLGTIERRWEPRGCDEPPLESLWSVCHEPVGGACGLGESRSCASECGEGVERCRGDCTDFGPCRPTSRAELALGSCDDAVLVGEGTSCQGSPETIQLVDGAPQARGARHRETVRVGGGPLTIEARARVARWTSEYPADGWAIVAHPGDRGGWDGGLGWRVGVDRDLEGYSLEWHFFHLDWTSNDDDVIYLRGLPAGDEDRQLEGCLGPPDCAEPATPQLDAGSAGQVVQRLRLVIEPDLPETFENDLVVSGTFVDAETDSPPVLECRGWACPVLIRAGDLLTVGITSATAGGDVDIEIDVADGLSIAAEQRCP